MILNYFKVAWRALGRSKGYSFINIMGLSIGLASVILIFIYIQDELTYDTAHPASSQTFGIGVEITNEQGEKRFHTTVPAGLAHLLKEQMPNQVAHIFRYYQMVWSYSMRNPEEDEVILSEDGELFFVEDSYAKVMHFPLIQGNRDQALTQPNSVVLSETAARRLFGDVNVLGRQLEMQHRVITDGYVSLEVTGVMEDYPGNIHMQPDYLISMATINPFLQRRMETSATDVLSSMDKLFMATYIRLTDNADLEHVEAAVHRIADEHFREANFKISPFLRNVTDFHFDDQVDWSWWNSQADYSYIVIFGSIGLMILLIACINYMNLATAKSARRAREIGVRKALGSSRWSLIFQFFQESLLTSFIALLIALLLVIIILPTYNQLSDKQFTLSSLAQADVIGALLVIWLIVAIVSSAYPAIFLSGFKTAEVLKGKLVLRKGSSSLRKALVIAQFAVSVLLIISTGIILQQMNLVENTKLYDNAESIMSIAIGPGIAPTERFEVLKNELLNNGDVEEITLAVGLPRLPHIHPLSASLTLPELNDQVYNWKRLGGDYNFPKMFNLKILAGRSFDEQNVSDSNNYLVNETAVQMLNITPDEVIGYTVLDTISQEGGRVIGVVEDFHFESIHTSIKPT
ncbi:MAG: ABC transporter permease, partial [Tunicatimonas sp.]|uniref:ABC transporter permease n=1 Tax=Tunicatimonas sp. TaxID=1940096 RepID=UPI003C706D3A